MIINLCWFEFVSDQSLNSLCAYFSLGNQNTDGELESGSEPKPKPTKNGYNLKC